MKRLVSVLLVLTLLLTVIGAGPAAAQAVPSSAPILWVMNEDVWAYSAATGQVTQLTQNAHVWDLPALSPDGTKLALLVASPITVQVWETSGGFSGNAPSDVALLDLQTGALTVVAGQPEDACLFCEGRPDNVFMRAAPTWSPDGTQIAWTELHYPSEAPELHRLMIYDLASGQTRIAATNLPQFMGAGPSPLPPTWGSPAIALFQPDFDQATSTFPTDFLFYTPEGALLSEVRLPDDDQHRASTWAWVETSSGNLFGVGYLDGRWDYIDPQSGQFVASGQPELVSLSAFPSLGLSYAVDVNGPWNANVTWNVFGDGGEPLGPLPYKGQDDVLIAPEGDAFAYLAADDQLTVWRGGVEIPTGVILDAYPQMVAWGPTTWRELAALGEVGGADTSCSAGLPTRLVVGDTAQVIPNTYPNAVRSEPGAGPNLGIIPAGDPFEVLAGPVCANGMLWWQVDYQGLLGWTAEGDASGYWIEPLG